MSQSGFFALLSLYHLPAYFSMNLRHLPRYFVLVVSLALPAVALASKSDGPKAKLMAKYDLNKNGKLDADEIATIRKDFAADPNGELKHFDTDNDGKLSDDEIAKMVPGSAKKSGAKKSKTADSDTKDSAEKPETADSGTTAAPAASTPAVTPAAPASPATPPKQ